MHCSIHIYRTILASIPVEIRISVEDHIGNGDETTLCKRGKINSVRRVKRSWFGVNYEVFSNGEIEESVEVQVYSTF
jgi:hypothetical protein